MKEDPFEANSTEAKKQLCMGIYNDTGFSNLICLFHINEGKSELLKMHSGEMRKLRQTILDYLPQSLFRQ